MIWGKKDISRLNLVNKENSTKTSYNVLSKETYFVVYISPKGELCITGEKDGNYIVWCSYSHINNSEHNEKLFNYIAFCDFKLCTSISKTMNLEQYAQLKDWYPCRLVRNVTNDGRSWDTPFGHGYGNQEKYWGKFFSRDIEIFFNDLVKKAETRTVNNNYIEILHKYKNDLTRALEKIDKTADPIHHHRMRHVISIIKDEGYLRLCVNSDVRNTYLECSHISDSLYNRYMTLVR